MDKPEEQMMMGFAEQKAPRPTAEEQAEHDRLSVAQQEVGRRRVLKWCGIYTSKPSMFTAIAPDDIRKIVRAMKDDEIERLAAIDEEPNAVKR